MLWLAFALPLSIAEAAVNPPPLGVSPHLAPRYRPGVCPNLCQTMGEAYRKQQDAEHKLRKTGSKIRASYIAFAQKEKKRLEAVIAASAQEIVIREKEVERLKEIADRTESLSAAALERKKKSPFYSSLITHSNALKSLQREHNKVLERTKALEEILSSLRAGYNPNYQDMAVLEAVRGWEFHAGLPHIGVEEDNAAKEEGSDEAEEAEEKKKEEEKDEGLEEGMWSKEDLEGRKLDGLLGTDYVGLLLEHDEYTTANAHDSLLFDISSYIPDTLLPTFQALKNSVVGSLEILGIVRGGVEGSATESTKARKAYDDAEHSLKLTREEKQKAEEDYADLFDVEGFGKNGEWKKLEGTCLEKDTGEYTYEVCLFDEARQKPNKGGTTYSLGKFVSWNNKSPDVKLGSPEYYSKQHYEHGARCWNGPERSVILVLSCGTENAIHSIAELEKCEYQFTGTTPALCLPLEASAAAESKDGEDAASREEL
ncbi:hypothetical protein PILCRDRAFT_819014 [Piloderma croceum F 1598]|uniref:MRH domain-containing protein n=1 Tax=Piloderma croceum (strain F 1598) TaxID=765440 RepID=A0A0C3G079_PILCF|nr:hypothetical protein PILCRDRAFT_819014 [Piloderma croceum F 1598]